MKRTLMITWAFLMPWLVIGCAGRLTGDSPVATSASIAQIISTPERIYRIARWSPDGAFIAAIGGRLDVPGSTPESVLIFRRDGTLAGEVAAFPGVTGITVLNALAWQDDRTLSVAVSLLTSNDLRQMHLPHRDAIFLIDTHDLQRQPHLLLKNLAPIGDLDWSPDAQTLLIEQIQGPPQPIGEPKFTGIMQYDRPTGVVTRWQFHDSYLMWPRWHPAGRGVVYTAATMQPDGTVAVDLIIRPWPDGSEQRVSMEPICGLYEPTWSPDGTHMLYREICNNVNDERIDHLVVAPRERPLEKTEICDGLSFHNPDWGVHGDVLALTIEFGQNRLVICDVPPTGA